MPFRTCVSKGKRGTKWGDRGKCYTGKSGKAKAAKQMRAIKALQARKTKKAKRR